MTEVGNAEVPTQEEAKFQEGAFSESLMGLYSRGKAASVAAADQAKIAARKTKLMAEIQWLEHKLKTRKQKFGEEVYDPLASNEHAEVDRLLAAAKTEMDELNDNIGAKRAELELLRAGMNP